MPILTQEQFDKIISMRIAKEKLAILLRHKDQPIMQDYPIQSLELFDSNAYINILLEFYGEELNIPDIFTQDAHCIICSFKTTQIATVQELDLRSIEKELNRIGGTDFKLSPNLKLRHDKFLDITIVVNNCPSVFWQLANSPNSITTIGLLILGVTLGGHIIGPAAMFGSGSSFTYTFFNLKKPGLQTVFSLKPLPLKNEEDISELSQYATNKWA